MNIDYHGSLLPTQRDNLPIIAPLAYLHTLRIWILRMDEDHAHAIRRHGQEHGSWNKLQQLIFRRATENDEEYLEGDFLTFFGGI